MQSIHPTKVKLAILTPILAAGSAWLCAAVAKYGIHLDPSGVNAALVTGAAAAAGVGVKLIHDVETRNPAVAGAVTELETAVKAADPSLAAELSA